MKKSPLQIVKERFGDKKSLVKEILSLTQKTDLLVERFNPQKGIERVSNKKLLRLYNIITDVKEKFGSRKKLIDEILQLENRIKDLDYRKRFEQWPLPRVYDYYKTVLKRVTKEKGK